MYDILIKNCTVVNGDQLPFLGSVAIQDELIAALLEPDVEVPAKTVIDGSNQALFPGIIDPHVHFHYTYNYRDNKEDYSKETQSALLGGVTTAIRMHRGRTAINEHLPPEIELICNESRIDMTVHLTLSSEDDLSDFPEICDRYGITSFKLYMAYKGKAGLLQGISGSDDGYLYKAMKRIGEYPGGVACIHAENSEIIEQIVSELKNKQRDDIAAWAEARPSWTEGEAIFRAGTIALNTKCPLYVVHVTSEEGIKAIELLRARGAEIYCEVCTQHLTHTANTPLGPVAKVNPPLRFQADVDALWNAIERGVVDTIATDHVAHTTAKANVPLWDVMPGNPGTATMLPVMLHYGYHTGRLSLSRIADLLSRKAADIFQMPNKGRIIPGADADLALVDLNMERVVDAEWLRSASDYSLYQGMSLKGWPTKTILRGRVAMDNGEILVPPGFGEFVERRGT